MEKKDVERFHVLYERWLTANAAVHCATAEGRNPWWALKRRRLLRDLLDGVGVLALRSGPSGKRISEDCENVFVPTSHIRKKLVPNPLTYRKG